jgi:putative DNA primase/helicase
VDEHNIPGTHADCHVSGDLPLATDHLVDLARSGITPETAKANRLTTVTDPHKLGSWLNWKGPAKDIAPAMAIPYYTPDRKFTEHIRIKPSKPRTDRVTGRPIKYESPLNSENRIYFPAGVGPEVLADPTVPIIIVEGEKKAIALAQAGFVAVAVAGVWSWCVKGEGDGRPKELITDFGLIKLDGRRVVIIFDSDIATNDRVAWAEWYFAEALRAKGAIVVAVRLPDGADEDDPVAKRPKVGADDYLVAHGPDALKVLIEIAAPPGRPNADTCYERTDLGNGRRFADYAKHYVRYVADQQTWYCFDRRRWIRDAAGVLVESRAKAMLRKWASKAAQRAATAQQAVADAPTKEAQQAAEKELEDARGELTFAMKSQDHRAIRRLMNMARSQYPLLVQRYEDTFDRDPWLLNAANLTIDLRTGETRPQTAGDYLTKLTPVAYDPAAEAPIYFRFLNSIFNGDKDLVDYVRRLGGVCTTADVSVAGMDIFHGGGANGKSTLLESAWSPALGEYAGKVPTQVLLDDGKGNRHPTELTTLLGLRLAIATETDDAGKLDIAKFKAITGGDKISCRFMRGDFFTFPPSHTLILCTNNRPEVPSGDHGTWRRLRLTPFDVKFWTDADVQTGAVDGLDLDRKADPTLPDRLRDEAPGILRDLVEQAGEYYRSGRTLLPPKAVADATKEYRDAEDVFGMFFAERVVPNPDGRTTGKDLYDAYRFWCEQNGYKAAGSRKFGSDAKRRYPPTKSNYVIYPLDLLPTSKKPDDQKPDNSEKKPSSHTPENGPLGGSGEDGRQNPKEHETRFSSSSGAYPENDSHPPDPPENAEYTVHSSDAGGWA